MAAGERPPRRERGRKKGKKTQQGRQTPQARERAYSEFLAMVSHELRTPLNVIIGYTDLLLEDSFGHLSKAQGQTLRRIRSYARELSALVTGILDVSQMEARRRPLALSEVQLSLMLQELAAETQETYQRPGLHFRWQIEGELGPIWTDPEKLKVVLRNLLGNAVKFTPQGSITVRAAAKQEGIEVRVSDTGIGIPQEALGFIFDPFRQVEHSTTPQSGGVGLGLYIVKQVLDLLGGTITVDSEVGRGSTFLVWVPQGQTPRKVRPASARGTGRHSQVRSNRRRPRSRG
jgi:signal transduction histidine kinase